MATWLLKTEPSEFSFADLRRDQPSRWDGVTNAQAVNFLREIKTGDGVFIYHTGDERAIVGSARVTRGAYADPDQPALDGQGRPKFVVIDLAADKAAKRPLGLAALKADARFQAFMLLTHARLSVLPVPEPLARAIRAGTGL